MSGTKKTWLLPVLLLFILQVWVVAEGEKKGSISWPPLPKKGFVKGRAASFEDVELGNAGFYFKIEGRIIGVPLDIAIPQYAIHRNSETGEQTPGIIIQGEHLLNLMNGYGPVIIMTPGDLIKVLEAEDETSEEEEI